MPSAVARTRPFANAQVAAVFASYPPQIRKCAMNLRRMILDTAATTQGVGELEETLKWGEPAYLTAISKTGTTIRIGRKKTDRSKCAMHFHCQTTLVGEFRRLYPDVFAYEGNRSIVFDADVKPPARQLPDCIALALNYHRRAWALRAARDARRRSRLRTPRWP